MIQRWKFQALGEIAEVQSGGTPLRSQNEYWSGEIPWYSSGELNDAFTRPSKDFITQKGLEGSNAKIFPKGSLLIGMYDTAALKMSILDRDAAFNQAIAGVKPNKNIDLKFILYAIDARRFEILNQRRGVRQKNLSLAKIKDIELPILNVSEQKRIVAIVDQAFEAIDVAIENTKQNLANARELFESYLNAIFSQKGDGWHERKLEDICAITSKLVDPRQPEFIDLAHVGAGNMTYLTGELIDVKTAREEELISGKFLFDETMVLYSKIRPYLMKACRPNFQGLCSADVYPLLPNDELLNRSFLFHLLMSRNFTDYAIAGSDRAGMPKVNRDHLFQYVTWIPNVSEQTKITKKIDKLAIETQRLEAIYRQKLAALTELKQSILQKAFTGELTADQEAP
jgi:type I restriction enzyme, S subunit